MKKTQQKHNQAHTAVFLAGILLLLASGLWLGKALNKPDINAFMKDLLPEKTRIENIGNGVYAAWNHESPAELLGYLAVGRAAGYGGELSLVVFLSETGRIINAALLEHRETPAFFKQVIDKGMLGSMTGKQYSDHFLPGEDIDAVSGATLSAQALATAARQAGRTIAVTALNKNLPEAVKPGVQFGPAEYLVFFLLLLVLLSGIKSFPYPRLLRWLTLLSSLIALGFLLNRPLSLISFNKLLLGAWPGWQTNLYLYLLLGGLLFFLLLRNNNPYCERICPFGAFQECIGLIGGGKVRLPASLLVFLRWLQRLLALVLIMSALLADNPTFGNFELSAVLFSFFGATWQFAFLGLILAAGLFVRRPWCLSLCPVKPVLDYFRALGRLLKNKSALS